MSPLNLRRFCQTFVLGLALTTTAAYAADATSRIPPLHGSLILKSMPLSSIVNRKITTWVYLPPGYDASATTRYPVVYLLHGQPGGWTDAYISGHVEEMADQLITSGQMKPTILVAFDGDGPKGHDDLTNFCNRKDGYRAEDFITDELVPYIDATYQTLPDATHRALWGYSGGGYGALNLGIHHPDLWKTWASHAGFYQADGDAVVMNKVLGPQTQNRDLWNANSPIETVKDLTETKDIHVYLDASPKEEDYNDFVAISEILKARGADVQSVTRPKAHAWKVVIENCRDSLLFINNSWGS